MGTHTRIVQKGSKKPQIRCIALIFCAAALLLPPYLFIIWRDKGVSFQTQAATFHSSASVQIEEPHSEVKHLWRSPSNDDGSFFVFDTYRSILPTNYNPNTMDLTNQDLFRKNTSVSEWRVVLGEGVIPALTFPTPYTYVTDLECVYNQPQTITVPHIQFLRYKQGEINYRNDVKSKSTFSLLDAYMTHLILCPLPSRSASLVAIRSSQADWEVDLKGAVPVPVSLRNKRLVMCVAPMYGSKNVRWVIEWLEYHRAIGVNHVHIPLWDDESDAGPLWELLRFYHESGFVTIHHWSEQASRGFTRSAIIYERAKNEAWNDCYLRNRGHSDWTAFLDIDEVLFTPTGSTNEALAFCDAAFKTDSRKVGCSMSSHTVTSVYKRVKPYSESHKLLLEEYNYGEATPKCPYNCGKYHRGRSKYLVRTREFWIPPVMLWTHALGGQDYTYADQIMTQVSGNVMNVHHYQAWWYTEDGNKLLPEAKEKAGSPVPPVLISAVSAALKNSTSLREMYLNSPGQLGVSWIQPLLD